jgi:hypothetical protein
MNYRLFFNLSGAPFVKVLASVCCDIEKENDHGPDEERVLLSVRLL